MSSGWGIVNGWCAGMGEPSSPSGLEQREVDHPQELQAALVDRGAAQLEAQQAEHVAHDGRSSATSNTRSPGSASSAVTMPASSASDRNLATGEVRLPSASTFIHTRPLAPQRLAWSVRSSSCCGCVGPALGHSDALDAVGLEGVELGGRRTPG
jgi:hypothetical protein